MKQIKLNASKTKSLQRVCSVGPFPLLLHAFLSRDADSTLLFFGGRWGGDVKNRIDYSLSWVHVSLLPLKKLMVEFIPNTKIIVQ